MRALFRRPPAPPPPTAIRLKSILADVERVRPLPTSISRILRALEDHHSNAAHIASLISLDQALAADVLRISNSAAYGIGNRSASVLEAVTRLGFLRIRVLVLGAATASQLTRRLSGYGLGGEDLWNHAVVTASLTRYLAEALHYPNCEEAYIAGLLHDIGKLVLDQYLLVDSTAIVTLVEKRGLQLWQAEEEVFGMDHGTVGGLMAAKWQFPTSLVDAIRCHHWPSLAHARPELAALVNVADVLPGGPRLTPLAPGQGPVHPEALRILNLDETGLARLRAEMPWQPGV